MITFIPKEMTLFHMVRYEDVVSYLQAAGWIQQTTNNQNWYAFTRDVPGTSQQLEIILPSNNHVPDMHRYLTGAINTLAAIHNETVEKTIEYVIFYKKDVWIIRDKEIEYGYSRTLSRSVNQITNINTLIKTAGSSEEQPLPYFTAYLCSGESMADRFGVRHTLGLGLTIEADVQHLERTHEQGAMLPKPTKKNNDGQQIYMIERRVMERIARGLRLTQQAIATGDIAPLVNNYDRGFAANACLALAEMSDSPMEHMIRWSPTLMPSEDVQDIPSIPMDETSRYILRAAAEQLRLMHPESYTIRGNGTSVTS